MEDRDLLELRAQIDRLEAELAELRRGPGVQFRRLLGRLPSSRRARYALVVAVLAVATASYAATISMPYTFVNGTPAVADEVNANFDVLVVESNDQDSRLTALESQVAVNTSGIGNLEHDVAANGSDIALHKTLITTNTSGIAVNSSDIAVNTTDIATLRTDVVKNAGYIGDNTIDIRTLQTDVGTNASNIATNSTDIGTLQTDVGTNTGNIAANTADITTNTADIGTLETTFSDVSRGGTPDTLTFSGMNVQVVDGSGDTDGTVNGLGNLIVGYNENNYSAARTGSHNLVVGYDHEYTSYAGLVAGYRNRITGFNASVSGGYFNTASGSRASVSGGIFNAASGSSASISGGRSNMADNEYSSVSGGFLNTASGWYSSVSGGRDNTASGGSSSVSGGNENQAGGFVSTISGGFSNTTYASSDVVVGISPTEYTVSATSTTPVTTDTAVHEYCALEKVQLQTGDPGTNKWCELTEDGDDTWTLSARGGTAQANVECKAICY